MRSVHCLSLPLSLILLISYRLQRCEIGLAYSSSYFGLGVGLSTGRG